jgi:pseudaminic acid cytidylyltransferase
MSNIAIIPARGGSKRIPKKNIRDFLGKPILSYAIELAKESKLFDDIIVSTDDIEIASLAKKFGANVPFFRSKENSTDFATTYDVLEEVIKKFEENNIYFENVCCIYPCTPLIKSIDLENAYNSLIQNNFDSVFPIVKFSNQIQRALKISNNKVEMFNTEFKNSRTQDLDSAFFDPGQFYWANITALFINKHLYSNNSGFIILDELCVQDIDNEIDWKLAELKYSLIK